MTSLTVIVPARNEERGIRDVVTEVRAVLGDAGVPCQMILVNDGSTDATGEILEDLKRSDPSTIEVLHHPSSRGLGGAYKSALPYVVFPFVTWLPADGEINPRSLLSFAADGFGDIQKDLVIAPYPMGSLRSRTIGRLILSKVFQRSLNCLFFNRIRYFNGNAIYPTRFVQGVQVRSNGYFFNAELLIRVLARFHPKVAQIPFRLESRKSGTSKALSVSNFLDVISSVTRLRISLWLGKVAGI